MKAKPTVKMVCEDCGKEPVPNKEESSENWNVIENKPCVYCGGKLTLKVEWDGKIKRAIYERQWVLYS